jgi:hypothetical protein
VLVVEREDGGVVGLGDGDELGGGVHGVGD